MRKYRINQPIMEIAEDEQRHILFAALVLLNVPGVLRQIADVFAKHNVNILSGIHYGPLDSRENTWIFSADFTNADASPEKVFKEIENLDVVLSVEYGVRRFGKLLLSPFWIELNVLDKEVIIQKKSWLREVNRVIVEEYGSGAEALVFHVGFKVGYRIVDHWMKASGLTGKHLIILAFEAAKLFNWISEYEILELDLNKPDIIFRVWNLMDCSPFREGLSKATSHYFRGMISGIVSRIVQKQIVFVETKCLAKGDPHCEFRIKS